ncbi:MAG TPA: hypothetical protein VL832_06460 [Puia sp.]|jgi:hypothetical protein|nr:hypothetical protein [Puia sp.]
MKPRCLIVLLIFVTLFSSCKKLIQQQEEKAALSIITNGSWYVQFYQQNDSDITASFSGYLFKFDADGIVTGTKDSVAVKGTWSTNIAARAVIANFPTAAAPVKYLNETWKITDSYTDSVVANSIDSITNTSNILHLHKL